MNPDKIDFVIYHNPCSDGTGSAWAAWKYLKANHPKREVIYHPTNHGSPPPDVTGRNVLICDFSYSKPLLDEMIKQADNLLIIDHHKTAQAALQDIPDKYKIFDMSHSGAYLTWMYFFPKKDVPLMIQYIQDRDIWTNKMPLIKEYASWFFTLDHNVEIYDIFSDDKVFQNMLETKGVGMVEKDSFLIKEAVPHCSIKFQKIDNRRFFIGYLNTTVMRSEVGNGVINYCKYADFAAVYSISDYSNSTTFSLRSTNSNYDASSVATTMGGGGHRNACGVKVSYVTNVLPGLVLDNNKMYTILENIYFNNLPRDNAEDITIVYCNTPIHKYDMGAYLLQDKYQDTKMDNIPIQESISIARIRNNEPNMYQRIQIAAVWHYDTIKNESHFKIVFDNTLTEDQTTSIAKLLKLNDHQEVTFSGLLKRFN